MTAPDRAVNALATLLMNEYEAARRRGVDYAGRFGVLAQVVVERDRNGDSGAEKGPRSAERPSLRVVTPTRTELEAERAEILDRWPRLTEVRDHCCGGCAETHVADIYGWGDGVSAYTRLTEIRYLLGDDEETP